MVVAFVFAPRWGLVGVALVHLVFNLAYCVARLAVLRAVTRVSGAIAAGRDPAGGRRRRGHGRGRVRAGRRAADGRLLSLVLVSAACAVAIAASSLLFARTAVLEAWLRLVRPAGA